MTERYEVYYEKGYHTLYDKEEEQVVVASPTELTRYHLADAIYRYEQRLRLERTKRDAHIKLIKGD